MIYYLYSSAGNTLGIEEYIGYFEVDDNGDYKRYLEIKADGSSLKYSEKHVADQFGQLPGDNFNKVKIEMSKKEYGITAVITEKLFNSVWANTLCINPIH